MPLLKQGHLEQMTVARWLLNIFKEGESTSVFSNFFLYSANLTVMEFCYIQTEPPVF